jgi:adenosylhomocysteine nucleosidase
VKALSISCTLLAIAYSATSSDAAGIVDATPRTAIISAYEPEWTELRSALQEAREYMVNGTSFLTGTIEGKPTVLFLSGVSMVNAAMTSQLALDRFNVQRIVFSGIAGSVDPGLSIGDVVVPEQWSQYLEVAFAREANGDYMLPKFETRKLKNFGMIFPQPVNVASSDGKSEKREWFPVDAGLLAVARSVARDVHLGKCTPDKRCVTQTPKVVVGGNGVSGQAFVDNLAFRSYVRSTFSAEVVDMESAAVAHVAYVNRIPFIAFRSISDQAGGSLGENEENDFEKLASANSAALVKAVIKALP